MKYKLTLFLYLILFVIVVVFSFYSNFSSCDASHFADATAAPAWMACMSLLLFSQFLFRLFAIVCCRFLLSLSLSECKQKCGGNNVKENWRKKRNKIKSKAVITTIIQFLWPLLDGGKIDVNTNFRKAGKAVGENWR